MDKVPNKQLREAFLKSGMTAYSVALVAGLTDYRDRPDPEKVTRSLGVVTYRNGKNKSAVNKHMEYERAVKIARALPGIDPVDVGL